MTTTSTASKTDSPIWTIVVGLAALAGLVAAAIGALSLAEALLATGLPNPGPVTSYGLPFVRAAAEIVAVVAVGAFLLTAFFVPPQSTGVLDVDGYRSLRVGTAASTALAVLSAVMVPLSISDVAGQPVSDFGLGELWTLAGEIETVNAWRWMAFIAAGVAIASRVVLRWSWTPLLVVGSVATLMPLALVGHSATGGAHDLGTNSLIIHLVSAALWAGGLVALLIHALRGGGYLDVAARRFSTLALWCYVAIGLSGIINALIRVQLSDLFTTRYGWLLVGKATALLVLGVLGYLQRRSAITALSEEPQNRRPLIRLAGMEAVIFAVTFGIAVGLGRTPPPPPVNLNPSPVEVAIGYTLDGPPTPQRLMFDWRFDLIFGTAAIVFAVTYLVGVRRLKARGDAWPVGRTIAWLSGCAFLLIATSSGVGRYMPAMFSMHMVAHMMLSMLVPVLLVLGGPITLLLRVLPAAGKGDPPGLREWVQIALHSSFSRFLTHPLVATSLFIGGFYGLYLSGLYDAAVDVHAAHLAMNVHFLLSGYLFYWVVIGIDPSPRRLPPVAKLGIVLVSLPLHAFFGVILMGTKSILGEKFYSNLALPWRIDLAADQHMGGAITWATGELPLLVVMIALVIQWSRSDERLARRQDRAADRDDDADLAAYNAMLAKMAQLDENSR
ncbi:copper resistance D domain-containing protein/Cytochrome c oxidase caa3 assembly factor [Mycolicibacterium phlei]|uniref:cytochrome c oxidase assembly protein n=1 Tax=Mycobacteroides chelonae TaxID=1774 RepID=UPI000618D7A6|nr:cytochrome c oxidase assembly protein [Mycobacteroides chelonae]VEG15847.1 copper resistance D domain-containing protein/Cytochrome c oxidase caa3 assembly factor [Mycolicibacterium phlei]AKC38514.1 copper resistance protein CopD [Mycobacteroides chelonae]ANA97753.1 copper resistance protein CopD [Mycobacteroides chelonae CCUG 47445]OLT78276.1 copper resistance protein CopD [Mycobacteroides chelonae]ORV15216.1 copper resistance protein CopD [Mycobacteroides chelonae]